MALIALAGPVGNFISALVFITICGVLARIFPNQLFVLVIHQIYGKVVIPITTFSRVLLSMMVMSIGLGIFNLIPIPPLDGSKVLSMFLPISALRGFFFMERWGFFIIMALAWTGILGVIMDPFFSAANSFLFWAINFIGGAG